jgi:hypothetical protein
MLRDFNCARPGSLKVVTIQFQLWKPCSYLKSKSAKSSKELPGLESRLKSLSRLSLRSANSGSESRPKSQSMRRKRKDASDSQRPRRVWTLRISTSSWLPGWNDLARRLLRRQRPRSRMTVSETRRSTRSSRSPRAVEARTSASRRIDT